MVGANVQKCAYIPSAYNERSRIDFLLLVSTSEKGVPASRSILAEEGIGQAIVKAPFLAPSLIVLGGVVVYVWMWASG